MFFAINKMLAQEMKSRILVHLASFASSPEKAKEDRDICASLGFVVGVGLKYFVFTCQHLQAHVGMLCIPYSQFTCTTSTWLTKYHQDRYPIIGGGWCVYQTKKGQCYFRLYLPFCFMRKNLPTNSQGFFVVFLMLYMVKKAKFRIKALSRQWRPNVHDFW